MSLPKLGKVCRLSRLVWSASRMTRVAVSGPCARRVERHVPVSRAAGQDEQVDAAVARDLPVVVAWRRGVGDPVPVPADSPALACGGVQPVHDLRLPEPQAAMRGRGVDQAHLPGAVVALDVLVHHDDHQAGQVEAAGRDLARQGHVRGPRATAAGAAEQESTPGPGLLDPVRDQRREGTPHRLRPVEHCRFHQHASLCLESIPSKP